MRRVSDGVSHQALPGEALAKIGGAVGLSSDATAGLLAASANVLAALSMVKDLKARDKVLVMSFAVCCAFLFGDHLSFTANFQPRSLCLSCLAS
nr:ethanolamine utilization protein EutH [Eggerthella sinensis]